MHFAFCDRLKTIFRPTLQSNVQRVALMPFEFGFVRRERRRLAAKSRAGWKRAGLRPGIPPPCGVGDSNLLRFVAFVHWVCALGSAFRGESPHHNASFPPDGRGGSPPLGEPRKGVPQKGTCEKEVRNGAHEANCFGARPSLRFGGRGKGAAS